MTDILRHQCDICKSMGIRPSASINPPSDGPPRTSDPSGLTDRRSRVPPWDREQFVPETDRFYPIRGTRSLTTERRCPGRDRGRCRRPDVPWSGCIANGRQHAIPADGY